jgi:hypothetical protein
VATTKRAQYRFRVKEGINDPFIGAEPHGREPQSEYPVGNLSFDLRPGTSLDEAQKIADFMNEHLLRLGVTKFGDVEDITREAKQDNHRHGIVEDNWRAVLEDTKASLRAEDVSGALKNLKDVEAWGNHLLNDWKRVLQRWEWNV